MTELFGLIAYVAWMPAAVRCGRVWRCRRCGP
jgi:hypothetical protein